jgi:FAD/FMN-containing dehydrogenase/Fe-S oxidoreductase
MLHAFKKLSESLEGQLFTDQTTRILYATDASAYREIPIAVACPLNSQDLDKLVGFARKHKLTLIPRAAGTSLAGQVVGSGLVVDMRAMNKILELNAKEKWVRVQPAVVRDELNLFLSSHKLFFAPETSTANRATIGGMIGNNSCGSNSVVYGSTREHLLELNVILSDGSKVVFKALSKEEFEEKLKLENLEGKIYRHTYDLLIQKSVREQISEHYPKPSIKRRNTGYALDLLMQADIFGYENEKFNFCKLIAGSEGTLCLIEEAKLSLQELPPPHKALICAHFNTIRDSLEANIVALEHSPTASELLDNYVLECTQNNIEQAKNRFFVKGEPKALLIIEVIEKEALALEEKVQRLVADLKLRTQGYAFEVVSGDAIKKVWELRKAGLGVLSNIKGDAKPVPVVEDTAVDVNDLPQYIDEFDQKMADYGLSCVHYAHAGSGELHLRPIINLKTLEGQELFRTVLEEVTKLVKKYRGSLSGEHGDGRLRGEFIPFMIGESNYQILKGIKKAFDPDSVFNSGKITDTPKMNSFLRYEAEKQTPNIRTVFSWESTAGFVRATEQCNGSGDCLKSELIGGTMCPSYMATRNERDSTRARANILREIFTHQSEKQAYSSQEVHSVLDLCLSCKACKNECPSNVDMSKMKAEFLNGYHATHGLSFRDFSFGNYARIANFTKSIPFGTLTYNFLTKKRFVKNLLAIHTSRNLPKLAKQTFFEWFNKRKKLPVTFRKVILFVDEFTNFSEVELGKTVVSLLEKLKYDIIVPQVMESGRAVISKGLLKRARFIAQYNSNVLYQTYSQLSPKEQKGCWIVGIEPSAILTLRDEYLDFLPDSQKAQTVAKLVKTFDEFIASEIESGYIKSMSFKLSAKKIHVHNHCYQKALSDKNHTDKILSVLRGCKHQFIPSGCCGMAGSFGYEKEHFEVSQKIGELVLFPYIKKTSPYEVILASGTSCRHQILEATGRNALHLAELLNELVI